MNEEQKKGPKFGIEEKTRKKEIMEVAGWNSWRQEATKSGFKTRLFNNFLLIFHLISINNV